jgi:nucleoid-associated protein YgaU
MNRQADPFEPRSRQNSDDGFMRYHIVKRGETLSTIAAAYYGDSNLADSLLEANRDVVSTTDDVFPGRLLRIPRSPTS